jgi:hypothetical protein
MKKLALAIGLLCFSGCASNSGGFNRTDSSNSISNNANQIIKSPKPFIIHYDENLARTYNVVKVDDSSLKAVTKPLSSYSSIEVDKLPTVVRKTYRVVVPKDIKNVQVKPTIEKILSKIISKDKDIDEITLFLYSDKKIINGAYDVATATWAPNGNWGSTTPEIAHNNDRSNYKIVIEVKPGLESYLKAKNNQKEEFGLSLEKRKKIYKELIASQDKAQAEADSEYSTDGDNWEENAGKNNQLRQDLQDKYLVQLAKKYHISQKHVWDIASEGVKKEWPLD